MGQKPSSASPGLLCTAVFLPVCSSGWTFRAEAAADHDRVLFGL